MQKLDHQSSYTPKQVTKVQIDRLFKAALPNSRYAKCKLSPEKMEKVCNDVLSSLKPVGNGYEIKYKAEFQEEDQQIIFGIFKDLFNVVVSIPFNKCLLSKSEGLRLLRPDYQKKFQVDENESIYIRQVLNRFVDRNKREGVKITLDQDLRNYCDFDQADIDRFYKFIDIFQYPQYKLEGIFEFEELVGIYPIVKFFGLQLENTRFRLLEQISNGLDETNFTCLLKNQQANDPDINDLLYWYLVQNEKLDFSPFSFSELIQFDLKARELNLEEMSWTKDLLEEMKKKMERGTFNELANTYLEFKKSNLLEKISWTQDLLNEMKKKLRFDSGYILLCKEAVRSKDSVIKEVIGSSHSSSTPGEPALWDACFKAWLEMVGAKF